jgi:hypothetical protein
MPDLSVFQRFQTKQDYDRAEQEFNLKKQVAQAQLANAVLGGQDPSAVREYQFYQGLDPNAQSEFLRVKRADQVLNLGNRTDIRQPSGGIRESYPNAPTPAQQVEIELKEREAQDQYNRGLTVQEKALEAVKRLNKNTVGVERVSGKSGALIPFDITDAARDARADLEYTSNLLTTENLGLLKGVLSDTDMKVLASLGSGELSGSDDRVKGALMRMETALSGRVGALRSNQTQEGMPPLASSIPPITSAELNGFPQAEAMPPQLPLNNYQRAEQEFNARKAPKVVNWEDLP